MTIQVDDMVLYYGDHIKIPVWLFRTNSENYQWSQKNRILVRVVYPHTSEPREEVSISEFQFKIESQDKKELIDSFGEQKIIDHLTKQILSGGVLLPQLMGEMSIHYRSGSIEHLGGQSTTNHTGMFVVSPVPELVVT